MSLVLKSGNRKEVLFSVGALGKRGSLFSPNNIPGLPVMVCSSCRPCPREHVGLTFGVSDWLLNNRVSAPESSHFLPIIAHAARCWIRCVTL